MALRGNLTGDLETFFCLEDFAQLVTYIDGGGVSGEIPAIFLTKSDVILENISGVESSLPALLVKRADAPDIKCGDAFEVDGVAYTVVETEYRDEMVVKAYISNSDRPLV